MAKMIGDTFEAGTATHTASRRLDAARSPVEANYRRAFEERNHEPPPPPPDSQLEALRNRYLEYMAL